MGQTFVAAHQVGGCPTFRTASDRLDRAADFEGSGLTGMFSRSGSVIIRKISCIIMIDWVHDVDEDVMPEVGIGHVLLSFFSYFWLMWERIMLCPRHRQYIKLIQKDDDLINLGQWCESWVGFHWQDANADQKHIKNMYQAKHMASCIPPIHSKFCISRNATRTTTLVRKKETSSDKSKDCEI